jgi:hypothetical protein
METERLTLYFVNGEPQRSEEDDLTVRAILERAGFKPANPKLRAAAFGICP